VHAAAWAPAITITITITLTITITITITITLTARRACRKVDARARMPGGSDALFLAATQVRHRPPATARRTAALGAYRQHSRRERGWPVLAGKRSRNSAP
jgi:hypothetical protein